MDKWVWTRPAHYILRECLGEGSIGAVYAAIKQDLDLGLEHHVAVKILKSRNAVNFIRQEIQTLSRIQSPYCVRFIGWEWINDLPALVMELISGVSLGELVQKVTLKSDEVLEIGRQIQAGLLDLEQQGTAHGDLSLNNVLISTEGQVKLVDFGLAGYRKETLGTLKFLAPELIGGGTPDLKSDLFSLGCLLRSLLPVGERFRISALLHQSADRRSPLQGSSTSIQQRALAERVSNLLRDKESSSRTAIGIPGESSGRKLLVLKKMSMALLIVGLLLAAQRSSSDVLQTSGNRLWAKVSVRTLKWVKVFIDEVDLGFAPLEQVEVPAGPIHLRWIGAIGRGEKILTLRVRERLVLDDSFFESQRR